MRSRILWLSLFSVIAGILGALTWSRLQPQPPLPAAPLPIYGAAPSFRLTDQTNKPFDSSTLKGRVWIADFIFTSCAGTCPGMSAKTTLLQQRLPAEIPLVSISVDPKRDTPPVLAEYALRYAAQPGRWFFLTGPSEEIRRVAQQGFHLGMEEGGSPEEPIIHSVRFVLVDREGMIRGYYDSTEPARFEKLIRDAGTL
ncbi:MAG: SCO family protein [Candidatus Omnitrophota bacterium]|nr:SCO family protein [Candidatus Omnitrophota bacterium]